MSVGNPLSLGDCRELGWYGSQAIVITVYLACTSLERE